MRALLIATLLLLPACSTMREAAAKQREFAEKGVPGVTTAAAAEAAAPAEPAAPANKAKALPEGLGGDKTNAAHLPPPQ
jgi:hypothetical protein